MDQKIVIAETTIEDLIETLNDIAIHSGRDTKLVFYRVNNVCGNPKYIALEAEPFNADKETIFAENFEDDDL